MITAIDPKDINRETVVGMTVKSKLNGTMVVAKVLSFCNDWQGDIYIEFIDKISGDYRYVKTQYDGATWYAEALPNTPEMQATFDEAQAGNMLVTDIDVPLNVVCERSWTDGNQRTITIVRVEQAGEVVARAKSTVSNRKHVYSLDVSMAQGQDMMVLTSTVEEYLSDLVEIVMGKDPGWPRLANTIR